MVKRSLLQSSGQVSPRRQPPRIRCCLSFWKVGIMVQVILGVHILMLLLNMDIFTFPEQFTDMETLQETVLQMPEGVSYFSSNPSSTTTTASYLQGIVALEKTLGARSCLRNDQGKYVVYGDFCSSSSSSWKTKSRKIIYYNSLPFDRIICGEIIQPNSYIIRTTKCNSPARLFTEIPHRQGNMKPVELSFQSSGNRLAQPFPCDVPCLSAEGNNVVTTRRVHPIDNGKAWTISFSMEGPLYYRDLIIKDGAYKRHHYYSTTSYESEIPLPYFSWAEYDIQSPAPVDFDTAIKGASFIAKNCASRNKREQLVKDLSQHFRVDSLSSCLHNASPPPGANLRDKLQTMRFYLFHLAFENQCYPDYITEKLWGPMQSGTIPVYFGSPNAKDHAPNNSLIMVDDFPTTEALAEYLNKVAHNRTLFEFHQQWRKEPLPPHFHKRYDFTEVHSTCRTCRWAYSKFYGLGWNHHNQSLRELEMPRYPCIDSSGQVVRPFVEKWLIQSHSTTSLSYHGPKEFTCYEKESEPLTRNDLVVDNALRRIVWQQDGVIDMEVQVLQSDALTVPRTLQVETPLEGATSVEQIEMGHVRIQNSKTRFTILTWPRRNVEVEQNVNGGILRVMFDETSELPLRLRVIVEDVETLRKGADKDENFFGSLMKRDFFNPVHSFSI